MKWEFWINLKKYRTRFIVKGSGEPLVLLHGLGSSLETWKNNLDYFAKYFRTYAFDMIGFGLADKPKIRYRLDVFAEFLKEFLRALKIEKTNLIGSSLGGLIALWFSINNQEMVRKLVIEASPGFEVGAGNTIKKYMGDWWTIEKLKKFYDFIYYRPIIDDKTLISRFKMFNTPEAKYSYKSTLEMPKDWKDLSKRLKNFKKPTLIIWGKEDKLIPVKHAYEFRKLMENLELIIFDETGHVPHAEKPKEFNRAVINFLAKL